MTHGVSLLADFRFLRGSSLSSQLWGTKAGIMVQKCEWRIMPSTLTPTTILQRLPNLHVQIDSSNQVRVLLPAKKIGVGLEWH